jgi:FixJ family two-component response regulator
MKSGATDFVEKPFEDEKLISTIPDLAGQWRARNIRDRCSDHGLGV